MKKAIFVLLAVCLIAATLAACAPEMPVAEYNLEELSVKIKDSGAFSDILSPIDDELVPILYGVDAADLEEVAVFCSTGATTEEIGLFKCVNPEAAKRVEASAAKRIISQKNLYESYAPKEPPKLDDAIVKTEGSYVFYIVSDNTQKVLDALR